MVQVHEETIDGPHGPLRVRMYEPVQGSGQTASPSAGLVWAHGGGFAFGDLDMPEADWVARQLADAGIAVVSVDYQLAASAPLAARLGVESREGVSFPVASEEVGAAFEWAAGRTDWAMPEQMWSLGGASAGANLSAGAALRLRDEGRAQPRSLVLAYPLLHTELPPHRPELAHKLRTLPNDARFPHEVIALLNLNYAGDESFLASPYAFPGTHDLHGLPPTFVLNSDADDLRSSGEQFAAELAAAGVDLLMIREDGTRHGHLNEPDNPGARRSLDRIAAWLTSAHLVGTRHEGPPEQGGPPLSNRV